MVNVLIPKQHEAIIKELLPNIKLQDKTENFKTFKMNARKFIQFFDNVVKAGYKPYSLMRWQ